VLQAVSDAHLVIYAPAGSHRAAIRARFEGAGIASNRLAFVPRVLPRAYLERYHAVDLCLDPFPFNGGTTTMDALWMGVPVVTLAGRTAVGRGGVSILSNLGLPEFVARSPERYVAIAADWARDVPRLAALRGELRARMQSSALTNGKQYATDVENAFRQIWQTWCGS
jgi:predicted O-linked N-acetylglucosamine transferase (SPINDLY family)